MEYQRYGWSSSLSEFIITEKSILLIKLREHYSRCMNEAPGGSQIVAWEDSIDILRNQLSNLIKTIEVSGNWTIIFEYELLRERGRRPDVIILTEENIIVIEFKGYSSANQSQIDQVSSYQRDLKNYHSGSHNNPVVPFLLLTKSRSQLIENEELTILSPDNLATSLQNYKSQGIHPIISPNDWINSEYNPLPSLITAARIIFDHEPLPQIRRAHSAGIPETVAKLIEIADIAKGTGSHHLALITGVPGAGKTLVGLQFVYHNHFESNKTGKTAVFLSGNGPLVKVLQHALKSPVFVQDVHGFLREYGGNSRTTPSESIFIYDEAQRAWDKERVLEKRMHSTSEPEDFLTIGSRKPWSLMIGLIGEGQEIHIGEEAGLIQWNDAIRNSNDSWHVHCPLKVANIFTAASSLEETNVLNLNETLRSHLATDLQIWVETLLSNQISKASELAPKIEFEGFHIYVTRNLDKAKNYVTERYTNELDKRFGLMASSKAKILSKYGVHNEYQFTKNFREGPWYNDLPSSRYSCCQLSEVATEFQCQGLELDFPIVCWGEDLTWDGNHFLVSVPQPRSAAKDPHTLRLNSYRVLLTRGRDGMIIFIPSESKLDTTYSVIINSGAKEI